MKKLLLATTALVASAGIASAGVKLTGYAEIGVIGGSGTSTVHTTQFHSDMDVSFHLSGQTDNGLSFGAKIDLDEVAAGIPAGHNNTFTNATVWVSGSFGKITLGDTDGALDWAMQEVGMGTTLTDDHTTYAGYSGNSGLDPLNGGQVLRYDNTFGDFGVALSASIDDAVVQTTGTVWGIGAKYNSDLGGVKLGLGAGYQKASTSGRDIWGISLDAKMGNGMRAILNYSDDSTAGKHQAIGVGYTSGPLLVTANYGKNTTSGVKGYGLAANYDLGGGAVVMAGYGNSNSGAASTWSLGLGLSF